MTRVRCTESGTKTGLHIAPKRRVRCFICSRLIQLRPFGEFIIVPIHYVPDGMYESSERARGGQLLVHFFDR